MNPKKPLIAVAAATGALALVAAPAFAAPPYTITAGSQTSGTVAVDAVTDGNGVYFEVNSVPMSCDWSTASASVDLGTSADGLDVGSITSSSWGDGSPANPGPCTGPANLPMNVTQTGTWALNLDGPVGNTVDGFVSNVSAHVSNPDGLCEFDVMGSVEGFVDQASSPQTLTVDNSGVANKSLIVENVDGCFGLLDGGPHEATFIGTFELDPDADGPLVIAD